MHLFDHGLARGTLLALVVTLGSWLAVPATPTHGGRVVVTESETTILDIVEFDAGTATLRPSSRPLLDAVAATLSGNPSIELVEVQSHTTDANLALSQQRAEVMVRYLVGAGVDATRLVAQGYGNSQPIDRAIPMKNERVSFLILKRSPDLESPAR